MKRVFLFFILLISLPASASPSFTGNWGGMYYDSDGQLSYVFSLDLKQNNDLTLTGSYCLTTPIKIDCPDPYEPEFKKTQNIIYGTVKGNTATIFFGPAVKGKKGKAILKFNNGILLWYMVREPAYTDWQLLNMVGIPKIQQFTKGDFDKDISSKSREYSLEKFIVVITNTCGEFLTACDKMSYTGIRRNDSSMISLTGKTTTDSTTDQVNGAVFYNGNTKYQIWYNSPFRLQVSQNGKILLDATEKTK